MNNLLGDLQKAGAQWQPHSISTIVPETIQNLAKIRASKNVERPVIGPKSL
jgi:hypothetical protein